MSKYQLRCSCIYCHKNVSTQGLKMHINKCTAPSKNACECCGTPTNNLHFCSLSCKQRTLNLLRPKKIKPKSKTRKEINLERFINGKIKERSVLRRYLAQTTGYNCDVCGIFEWQKQNITLIVDHIDGNASNNKPCNLRLLCPNCNSQTSTFGGRNKGNGRKARGLPLY